jgi:hypothetical protein
MWGNNMATLFGQALTRAELLRYGPIEQFASVRLAELSDGPGRGVRIAELIAGELRCTVLIDRGLDLADASFAGVPLAWRSGQGITHPAMYDAAGTGWLRSFPGGLLTTCGFTSAGAPSVDVDGVAELHGRASNLPAHLHEAAGRWDGDEYLLSVAGQTREVAVFGFDLLLTRRISIRLGETRIVVQDTIENMGDRPAPLMLLYHCNFGYPLVAPGAAILSGAPPMPRDPDAEAGAATFPSIHAPVPGYREQVFFHTPLAGPDGYATAAIVNRGLLDGRGLAGYVRFRPDQMPNLIVWKQLGHGTYVVGLEPANCLVMGRAAERERGTLQSIAPGEVRYFTVELGAATGAALDRLV